MERRFSLCRETCKGRCVTMITKYDIVLLLAEMIEDKDLEESLNELDLTEETKDILRSELDRRKNRS